jgi:hypothetical protein
MPPKEEREEREGQKRKIGVLHRSIYVKFENRQHKTAAASCDGEASWGDIEFCFLIGVLVTPAWTCEKGKSLKRKSFPLMKQGQELLILSLAGTSGWLVVVGPSVHTVPSFMDLWVVGLFGMKTHPCHLLGALEQLVKSCSIFLPQFPQLYSGGSNPQCLPHWGVTKHAWKLELIQ